MSRFLLWLGLLLVGFSTPVSGSAAEPPALLSLREKYEKAALPIELERNERCAALKQSYLTALEKEKQEAMAEGNLDVAVGAKEEKARLVSGASLTGEQVQNLPKALKRMCAEYDRKNAQINMQQDGQLDAIRQRYIRNLATLEKRLTKADDLEGALIVREERERFGRVLVKKGAVVEDKDEWCREWQLVTSWAEGNTAHRSFEKSWHAGEIEPKNANRPVREESRARKGILEIHPVNRKTPAKLAYKGRLNRSTPILVVEAAGNVRGDCVLKCIVSGREYKQYVLRGDRWSACEFDLSEFANRKPEIELWNTGGGKKPWFYEHCYIDKIYFK